MPEFAIQNIVKQKLYAGELFKFHSQFTLPAGAIANMLISPVNMHIVSISLLADGPNAKAELFLGPSVSAPGPAVLPQNMNRKFGNNIKDAQSKLSAPATFNSNGLLLDSVTVFGPESTDTFGSHDGAEWVLNDLEDHAIVISNTSAATVGVSFGLTFYEDFL